MPKPKTNEQLLRALFADLRTEEAAILRERIVKISEITRESIKEDPSKYDGPIWHHSWFLSVCDKVDKHLRYDD